MKLSICPIGSFGDLLIVTTAVVIALSHPIGALAQTTQQLAQMVSQTLVPIDYTCARVSAGSLAGKDIFHLLRAENTPQKQPDNPAPVPGSPGGSR